jgi:hypothetical protein
VPRIAKDYEIYAGQDRTVRATKQLGYGAERGRWQGNSKEDLEVWSADSVTANKRQDGKRTSLAGAK